MLSCCGEFNDALATYILQNREAVLERNREIVFRNMAIAQEWIDSEPRVTWQAPKGVSVAYIQWDIPMDDEEFCIKLLKEEGVLLVPGNRFELPGGARLGYCAPEPVLREGLARLGRALRQFDQPPLCSPWLVGSMRPVRDGRHFTSSETSALTFVSGADDWGRPSYLGAALCAK